MGRTVMPFSFVLEAERSSWNKFRKSLSKEDQQAFDRLFDRAHFHTAAAVYQSHPCRWKRFFFPSFWKMKR